MNFNFKSVGSYINSKPTAAAVFILLLLLTTGCEKKVIMERARAVIVDDLQVPTNQDIIDVDQVPSGKIFAKSETQIYTTIDNGFTWFTAFLPTYIHKFHFVNDSFGLGGRRYDVQYTTNGGSSWTPIPSGTDFTESSDGRLIMLTAGINDFTVYHFKSDGQKEVLFGRSLQNYEFLSLEGDYLISISTFTISVYSLTGQLINTYYSNDPSYDFQYFYSDQRIIGTAGYGLFDNSVNTQWISSSYSLISEPSIAFSGNHVVAVGYEKMVSNLGQWGEDMWTTLTVKNKSLDKINFRFIRTTGSNEFLTGGSQGRLWRIKL